MPVPVSVLWRFMGYWDWNQEAQFTPKALCHPSSRISNPKQKGLSSCSCMVDQAMWTPLITNLF
jgi:hypothetical protein